MKSENLSNLIKFCKDNDRIIPCPSKWTELWEMLPNRKREGNSWDPAIPLILGAWWHSSEQEKQSRFFKHLEYAEKSGVLKTISTFLRNLDENDWCHSGEAGGLSLEDFYYSNEIFKPKEKPSKEIINQSLRVLQNKWSEIAGDSIAQATEPVNFSGKKSRRLNIKILNSQIKPSWGSWWTLEYSEKPESFTKFRAKINSAICPHSIDHIFFYQKGKRSK